jgi:acylphosphatase
MLTKGQTVKQVISTAIEGEVVGFSLNQQNGEVLVLVSFKDADGNDQTRYFKQSEITSD